MISQKFLGGLLFVLVIFLFYLIGSGEGNLSPTGFYEKYFASDTTTRSSEVIAPVAEASASSEVDTAGLVPAELYKNGKRYYEDKDYGKALIAFQQAADKGEAGSQYYLGLMYANGEGFEKNEAEAVKWYRLSAEQGDAYALNNLGWMLRNGWGTNQNFEEALLWYRKAADQGNARAQTNLGWMYENGKGVNKDIDEAVKWYRKAADQDFETAKKNLKRLDK